MINAPAKYKCIVLCTSVPGYTPMESEAQIFPKRHLCSGEERSKCLDLSARWSCSHPLPWRLSKDKFILFGRSRDETLVKYSVTAVVNGEEGETTTLCVNEY